MQFKGQKEVGDKKVFLFDTESANIVDIVNAIKNTANTISKAAVTYKTKSGENKTKEIPPETIAVVKERHGFDQWTLAVLVPPGRAIMVQVVDSGHMMSIKSEDSGAVRELVKEMAPFLQSPAGRVSMQQAVSMSQPRPSAEPVERLVPESGMQESQSAPYVVQPQHHVPAVTPYQQAHVDQPQYQLQPDQSQYQSQVEPAYQQQPDLQYQPQPEHPQYQPQPEQQYQPQPEQPQYRPQMTEVQDYHAAPQQQPPAYTENGPASYENAGGYEGNDQPAGRTPRHAAMKPPKPNIFVLILAFVEALFIIPIPFTILTIVDWRKGVKLAPHDALAAETCFKNMRNSVIIGGVFVILAIVIFVVKMLPVLT